MNAPQRWRFGRIIGGSGTISHGYIATAPGCPSYRHPTRWCACRVFRTLAEARAYARSQQPFRPEDEP